MSDFSVFTEEFETLHYLGLDAVLIDRCAVTHQLHAVSLTMRRVADEIPVYTRTVIDASAALRTFTLAMDFTPDLRMAFMLWGDTDVIEDYVVMHMGITRIDIRRIDVERWCVVLWNGRKVALP